MPKKPKLGRPRRGKSVAEVSTVRVDEGAKAILQHEFGSLGNALYFVARGISLFRKKHGMPGSEPLGPDTPAGLTFQDLVLIREVFWHRIDRHRGPDGAMAPTVAVLRKLEALLYGTDTLYGDLPPVAGVDEPPPKTRKRSSWSKRFRGVTQQDVVSEKFKATGLNPHARPPLQAKGMAERRRIRERHERLRAAEALAQTPQAGTAPDPSMSAVWKFETKNGETE